MGNEFVIRGGRKLEGEVIASGNKNAALPLLAASLLTDEPLVLHNVPRIRDVETMLRLIQSLGVAATWIGPNSVRLCAAKAAVRQLDKALCSEIRASILLAGPMLGRFGEVHLHPPGGDVIGRRRLDTHFLALRSLGARVSVNGQFDLVADGLRGADILLDEASVTATENAVMAAALASGTTVLRNAASEPHVQDLCRCLIQMGASIENVGSNTLVIHGRERLGGAEFTLGADNIEVTSFIVIGALCGGERGLWIRNAGPEHLGMTRLVLRRLGIHFEIHGSDVFVPGNQRLVVQPEFDGYMPKIDDNPWPAFPRRRDQPGDRRGHPGRGQRAVPREDVREPAVLGGQADRHGRADRALRSASLRGARPQPPAGRSRAKPGYPGRRGAGDRRALRRGRERHPERRAD
jgi:UDP-N-acetylglucosamine 1-carboxyvinyltransferase